MAEAAIHFADRGHGQTGSTMLSPDDHVETILICNNSLLAIGLQHLLKDSCFRVSATAYSVPLLSHNRPDTAPALLIVDASSSPGQAIETIKLLKVEQPDARVVVVADNFDLGFLRSGLDAGVGGFCQSSTSREVLIKSLELVMVGETILPTALVHQALSAIPEPSFQSQNERFGEQSSSDTKGHKLSLRETEILRSLMSGAPNKVIARNLDVAEATVKVHIKAILRKIGAANRTQAAMWASEHMPTKDGSGLRA